MLALGAVAVGADRGAPEIRAKVRAGHIRHREPRQTTVGVMNAAVTI